MDIEPPPYDLPDTDRAWAAVEKAAPIFDHKKFVFDAVRKHGPKPTAPLLFSSVAELAGVAIPERRWVVPGWLPAETVALLYGAGGEGKTLLAQQLLTSIASGRPWLGLTVQQGTAIGLFCEDDEDEMHRRQEGINRAYGIDYGDLQNMHWTCPVGSDNTLIRFEPDGTPVETERFLDLKERSIEFRPSIIVLDVASDLYGGNENDRGQVSQFLKATLGNLARESGACVLVNAHPSKSSISSGDLDSGSTGWNGGVRTRLTLMTPKGDEGEPMDESARVLRKAKANYSRRGDELQLQIRDGVMCRNGGLGGGIVAGLDRRKAEEVFLELLDKMPAAGIHVSHSRNAGNYAPKLFSMRPDRHGFTKRDFEIAMQSLFAISSIKSEPYGKPSDRTQHLVRIDENSAGDGLEEGGDG